VNSQPACRLTQAAAEAAEAEAEAAEAAEAEAAQEAVEDKGDDMKKLFAVLAAVCVALSLSVTAFADDGVFISDGAGFFTDSEYSNLLDKADETYADTGYYIMIITDEGYYSQSEARSTLKTWYGDEFGSSNKGAALIMTSESSSYSGNNDYTIIIETFGGAKLSNKTQTLNRIEDYFLDYDEYRAADTFLSACGGTSSGSSGSGSNNVLVIVIVVVLIVGAIVVSVVKNKIRRAVIGGITGDSYNDGYSGGYRNNRRYRNNRNNRNNRSSGGSSSSGRSGKR
jgi:hypothetical protein